MTLEQSNVLVHDMKGTGGGKDSICWREFMKDKMKCTCKVRNKCYCTFFYSSFCHFTPFFFLVSFRSMTSSLSACTTACNDPPLKMEGLSSSP